jgi:hypothetical protein
MSASAQAEIEPPAVLVESPETAPVAVLRPEELRMLGDKLQKTFTQYVSDRRMAELKWLRNLRQFLGVYDEDVAKQLDPNRSKAYPRITRVKVISTLSRIMNLMFPGNERNWEIRASPSPDMSPEDVQTAVQRMIEKQQKEGLQPTLDADLVEAAAKMLADERAQMLTNFIDDQLQELGGDQTYDYVQLNRKVLMSGILYGVGVLRGPFAKQETKTRWGLDAMGMPAMQQDTLIKPQYEFLSVWDFYPDMSAKTLRGMDGYFIRLVMTRAQLRKLADRQDFFAPQIRDYLRSNPQGNYKLQPFETDLRTMGVAENVNVQKPESNKYEVIIWNGSVSGSSLSMCGVEVPEDRKADDIDAEVWMVDGNVIKATMNPWRKLGYDVPTIHAFVFDEDDTSPVGNGLPAVMRDSQMAVANASRMLLDNASVVCGPNLEINTDLMRPDQDMTSVTAYKIWYREGNGADAQYPAARAIPINSHIPELVSIIELFMKFADAETFVGPMTGGDMERGPSEPMRTAAGASMLRGDAALPFKDIVRNFDAFTQSVIHSIVCFNRAFNPDRAPAGDYNIIARGATSLVAKEIKGIQVDQLAQTLTPAEMLHVDERKLVEARLGTRDLSDMLVPAAVAESRRQAQMQAEAEMREIQKQLGQAQVRAEAANAYKDIAQANKNSAAADKTEIEAASGVIQTLRGDSEDDDDATGGRNTGAGGSSAGPPRQQ